METRGFSAILLLVLNLDSMKTLKYQRFQIRFYFNVDKTRAFPSFFSSKYNNSCRRRVVDYPLGCNKVFQRFVEGSFSQVLECSWSSIDNDLKNEFRLLHGCSCVRSAVTIANTLRSQLNMSCCRKRQQRINEFNQSMPTINSGFPIVNAVRAQSVRISFIWQSYF